MKSYLYTLLIIIIFWTPLFAQDVIWQKSIGGNQSDYLHDIIQTNDGFILAGSSLSDNTGNKADKTFGDLDYFIYKLDKSGNQIWQHTYGGSSKDELRSIATTRDGGYILGGNSSSNKSGDKLEDSYGLDDFWVIKLNPKGEIEWQFTLGGVGMEDLLSIQQTKDNGYILGGTSDSPGIDTNKNKFTKTDENIGSTDYWIIKLTEKGDIQWQKTIGGIYREQLTNLVQTYDNGYLIGGNSNSPKNKFKQSELYGKSDYWIVKLDAEGELLWERSFGGNDEENLSAILPLADEGFLLGGTSFSEATGNKYIKNENEGDWWLLKIDSNGNLIWQQTYDISSVDVLSNISSDKNENFTLTGYAQGTFYSKENNLEDKIEDYYLIKIDNEGNEFYRTHIGGGESDRLQKVIYTDNGDYLLAGTSESKSNNVKNKNSFGREDYWVIKYGNIDKINEFSEASIIIYPNPSKNYVNIVLNEKFNIAELQIFDMLGKLVMQSTIKNKVTRLNTSQLQTGTYVVKISTEQFSYNYKLLKK